MSKYPDWLPTEIASHVQTLIHTGGLGAAKATMEGLASHPEMKKVWQALQPLSNTPQQLVDYFDTVRLHPVVNGWPTDILNVPGDAVQRELFSKIRASCDVTLNALKGLSHKNDPMAGWGIVEQAIQRSERRAAQLGDTSKLEATVNFRGHLQTIQASSTIPEILEAIKLAAALAYDAPDMNLPRRRDSLKAARVLLAQDLSHYVRHHFRKPLHDVVATTVNVALNLGDDAISAESVRKLKRT